MIYKNSFTTCMDLSHVMRPPVLRIKKFKKSIKIIGMFLRFTGKFKMWIRRKVKYVLQNTYILKAVHYETC